MSELQNRAVELLNQQSGSPPMTDAALRHHLLTVSLGLYRAMGGSEPHARDLLQQSFAMPPADVPTSVGDLMMAVAGLSHLQDIDMVQAAYNTLDRGYLHQPATASAAE
ncbi:MULTISPECIES: hypothetical protein [Pseudorhizobium]|jgi:hypothetical protein|uniref:hypothetical protein n=1 Tax=Pseudorhizobium TaxID=1903858 RepID=UPI0006892264|nr:MULTISPECIES: hypothetical protein [Pseudorhizobium]MBU1316515.1 hypothetical protein [Alphaproteobacteria bacterium]MDY6961870.1 hypothetical protein [Pseudomonadota bacterium]MBU1548846.1 hypothetical protein [Alphaproteobacteria bacterium]MBU2335672.1 hypothetical protein [Alphaproteobacteria bacterium]MBU2390933.1 hypothetical protein [Alphaproteobacteria bacterium]|tara:strand:- start:767 stop:1093 length:327 start_codon:yes stop_codon:yes gene_type:complete